jgi:hypothetical protein
MAYQAALSMDSRRAPSFLLLQAAPRATIAPRSRERILLALSALQGIVKRRSAHRSQRDPRLAPVLAAEVGIDDEAAG